MIARADQPAGVAPAAKVGFRVRGGDFEKAGEASTEIKSLLKALEIDPDVIRRTVVVAFEAEMKAAGVDYKLVKYPGAVHSFTHKEAGSDNAKGAAYNADADRDSWFQMEQFLKTTLSR